MKTENKTIKKVQSETAKFFTDAIESAGLAELHAIDKRIDKHYHAGTLSKSQFGKLAISIMENVAKFEEEPRWVAKAFDKSRIN